MEIVDRAELVVKRALNCGWVNPETTDIKQLKGTIRIALDTEVRAGGPYPDFACIRDNLYPDAKDQLLSAGYSLE